VRGGRVVARGTVRGGRLRLRAGRAVAPGRYVLVVGGTRRTVVVR
jgi:hypothetical protein